MTVSLTHFYGVSQRVLPHSLEQATTNSDSETGLPLSYRYSEKLSYEKLDGC
jgi:hypothetical protein